jgi:putative ABC transport system permease protein
MGTFLHDLRYELRILRKSPGFSAAAMLTLAIGLSTATIMFSVVNTVLLRPLPFKHSERILCVTRMIPFFGSGRQPDTLDEYLRWRKAAVFTDTAALGTAEFTLLGAGVPERLEGVAVTPEFFRIFGVQPTLGRDFRPDENAPNAKPVVILSHELWARKFHSDPRIIGNAIRLGDDLRIVIGVMPKRFDFPRHADLAAAMDWAPEETEFWIPLQFTEKEVEAGNFNYLVIGRIAAGVSRLKAQQELQAITHQVFVEMANANPEFGNLIRTELPRIRVNAEPLQQTMTSDIRSTMWILFAAVAVLVVLMYANVASLFLTRNAGRMREFVIRQALGASNAQILRQTLLESSVLTAGAAILGLLPAIWGIEGIRAFGAVRVPRLYDLSLDYRVAAWLVFLAVLASVLFGAAPWLIRTNRGFAGSLQEQGRTTTGGRREQRLRRGLVLSEIALTVVLLLSAALLVQSLRRVFETAPGFDPGNLLTATIGLQWNQFPDQNQRYQHFEQLLASIRRLPEVESASMVNALPLTGEVDIHTLSPLNSVGHAVHADSRVADPDYLRTMRIPLVRGRWFRAGAGDRETVAVISDNLAHQFWPKWDPIGRQFRDGDNPPMTVVGVAGAVRNATLEQEPTFQFYRPAAADVYGQMSFVVRTRTASKTLIEEMSHAIQQLDPEQPVAHARTMDQIISATTLPRRFETWLLGCFAASALFLSGLGMFSVLSLSVVRRRREFGIRMALGATTGKVLLLVLGEASELLALGAVAGAMLSLVVQRFLRSLVYGVGTSDPLAYAATLTILGLCGFVACWVPARRASNTDPMVALSNE